MMPFGNEMIPVIEKVVPCVVNISILRMLQRDYFTAVPVRGMGSGFITSRDGRIVTDYHIVEDADRVEVSLSDGRKLAGRVTGTDANTDIALVKGEATGLPTAELGDSDKLRVGQLVVAIGNPFGFLLGGGPTVTMGVVSALNRHISAEGSFYENLIQTDAAINPGNSGGPLIDAQGKVVGINTANIPFAQGIGFAIPINTAKGVVEDLIAYGRVIRPWIGIMGLTVTREVATHYGLPVAAGVAVLRVLRGGPADHAGIEEGDVIIATDGAQVDDMESFQQHIRKRSIGDEIELVIMRGDKKGKVRVTIEEAPP